MPDDVGFGQGRRPSDRVAPLPSSSPCDTQPLCNGPDCNIGLALAFALIGTLIFPGGLCSHSTSPPDEGPPPLVPRTFAYESRPYAHNARGFLRKRSAQLVPSLRMPAREPQSEEPLDPMSDEVLLAGTALYPNEEYFPPEWFDKTQRWAFQLAADIALIDGNSWRLRPRARLLTPSRIELEAETALYRLADDDQRAGIDWITLSAARLSVRIVQTTAVQVRLSGGPAFYTGGAWRFGGTGGVSFDAFVHKPLILSGSFYAGSLGNSLVTDARASLGIIVGAVEVMGGFEYIRFTSRTFAGPTIGVRLWF